MIGKGPNKQIVEILDSKPDGGGPPVKLLVPTVDAFEWQRRDPTRYQIPA